MGGKLVKLIVSHSNFRSVLEFFNYLLFILKAAYREFYCV